jgi:PhzF family phenazine biosynthesis protein
LRFPIYQVDAFADAVFAGNPAAVVLLDRWLPDDRLRAIAAENAQPETAFVVPAPPGAPGGAGWELRWFTPRVEVELCGHATLAAAFVLSGMASEAGGKAGGDGGHLVFATRRAGALTVAREGGLLTLDFPARPPRPVAPDPAILSALGVSDPVETLAARDYVVVLADEDAVRALRPDTAALARAGWTAAMVTAPGREADCASRFFAPAKGVPEDPVTGSAHCTLVPYWAARLGRDRVLARQVSARGGTLRCRLAGDRVLMSGRAALYLEGIIDVPVD